MKAIKINSLTVELMVLDIQKTIKYYKDLLGFKVTVSVPEKDPFFVVIANGIVEIMLYKKEQFVEEIPKFKNMAVGGSVALYINVENIEDIYNKIKSKIKIIQKLHKTDYGTVEFFLEDCNGYVLMFCEK